jgi:hypothetical protein
MPGAPLRRRDALPRDGVGVVCVQRDNGQRQERERDSGHSAGPRLGPKQYCHVSNEVYLSRTFVADLLNSLASHPPEFACSITPRDKLAEDLIRASALA